jgi:hypothetical protein
MAFNIGDKVLHKGTLERGVIEEFRAKDGCPLVRWEYGNLLRCSPDNLRLLTESGNKKA